MAQCALAPTIRDVSTGFPLLPTFLLPMVVGNVI